MTINEILKALKNVNDDTPVFVADTLSVELTGEVMSWDFITEVNNLEKNIKNL